jgi:hypothetical protein
VKNSGLRINKMKKIKTNIDRINITFKRNWSEINPEKIENKKNLPNINIQR